MSIRTTGIMYFIFTSIYTSYLHHTTETSHSSFSSFLERIYYYIPIIISLSIYSCSYISWWFSFWLFLFILFLCEFLSMTMVNFVSSFCSYYYVIPLSVVWFLFISNSSRIFHFSFSISPIMFLSWLFLLFSNIHVTTSLFVFFLLLIYNVQNLFQLLESLPICSIFMSLHSHAKCIIFAALSLHTREIFSCFLFLYSSISDSVFVFNQNLSVCGWYFSITLSGSM